MIESALFLAIANKALVNYISAPLKQKFPDADFWWMVYVALATGAALGWLSGINIFEEVLVGITGRVLTSLFVGGGSSLIYDIFDKGNGRGDTVVITELVAEAIR